jgi:hypothetical protein
MSSTTSELIQYGILSPELTEDQKLEVLQAAEYFGEYFYDTYGTEYGFTSPEDAFKSTTGGYITIGVDSSMSGCSTTDFSITCGPKDFNAKTLVHEYFHVFDNYYQSQTETVCSDEPCWASNNLPYEYYTDEDYTLHAYKFPDNRSISHPPELYGYDFTEAFANAGENLILGALGVDLANNGFDVGYGDVIKGWMEDWIPIFLDEIMGVE